MPAADRPKSYIEKLGPRRPSLKINAVSNWFVLALNIIAGLLLTPFIVSHLGKSGYGIWTFIGSFIGYYGLLNLGVGAAITRYVARYAGRGDDKSLNETASTAMAMFCCTGVLAIAISFLFAEPLARYFHVAPEYFNDFKYVVWILGLATGLSFPGNVFGTIVIAHERFVAANSAKVLTLLTRTGLTVIMLLCDKGLVGVAYATLFGIIVNVVANLFVCRYFAPGVRINFGMVKWRVLRMLLVYSVVTTVIVIADLTRINLDSFVIGKFIGMSGVGVYGIAAVLIRYMLRLIVTGTGVLTPRFARIDGEGNYEELRNLFLRSLAVSALFSFGVGMLAILFGGRFIVIWVGEEFAGAIPVLWILAGAYAFGLSQSPAIGLTYALNKHRFYAVATIIEAIANLILSIVLVTKFGIIGVALGTAIPMLIVKVFVQPIYVSRIIGISVYSYLKRMIIPFMVAIAIIAANYQMMVQSWQEIEIFKSAMWAVAICLIFVITVMFLFRLSGLEILKGRRGDG
ncbi:MAG: oligosaccharide flippase family protein [Planctomycetota bacterium]|jgi:O-antigen/teichoic acid export membrane protein